MVAKAEIKALKGTPERHHQLEEEPMPGSEVTCRRRIYEKRSCKTGKKELPMPGKSKRRNEDHKKQTRQAPGKTCELREREQTSQGAGSDRRHRPRELPEDTVCSGARFKIARAFSW